jgi:pimeloyl-ACP methyl ester carboxylesterase
VRVRFRVSLAVFLAAFAALAHAGESRAAGARSAACDENGLTCTTLRVPIDSSGMVPGTLPLYMQQLSAEGLQRGVMFLLAGGPGQPSAEVFNLGKNAAMLRNIFSGYRLVAFDPRGTGKSDLLSCPSLQAAVTVTADEQARLAGQCAATIGPTYRFYATRDHVEDIESVRKAVGVDKIGLWGTSYGTKLAVAYALAYPQHVDRLLLDSILPPEGHDSFATDTLQNLPRGLANLCYRSSCSDATPNLTADLAALANRLQAKPLVARVPYPRGRSRKVMLDGVTLLGVTLDTDLNPGLAAEFPAAVHAALHGSTRPLLRIVAFDQQSSEIPVLDLSFALLVATNCNDGRFPWAPDTPIAERQAIYDAARARLLPGATGPFGKWATDFGTAKLCIRWPSPSGGAPIGPGPLPDVPVLLLAGDRDLRTPVANAFAVAARFPQGRVVVVPGVGHSVQSADFTGCATTAITTWLEGRIPPAVCPRVPLLVAPLAAFPRSVGSLSPVGASGLRGRTLAAAIRTVREAGATWLFAVDGFAEAPTLVPGPYGGTLRPAKEGPTFKLNRYSVVPGVELTGTLQLERGPLRAVIPFRFVGSVTVTGAKAAHGKLTVGDPMVTGSLAGSRVRARS